MACGSINYKLSDWKWEVIIGTIIVEGLKNPLKHGFGHSFFTNMIFEIHVQYLTLRIKPSWISLLTFASIYETTLG